MKKEELLLLLLHMLVVFLREHFIKNDLVSEDSFPEYNALKITPAHIYKSKAEHKKAMFILLTRLVELISEENFSKKEESKDSSFVLIITGLLIDLIELKFKVVFMSI